MAQAEVGGMRLHPPVGHEDVRAALAGAHARGSLPAAILLRGERGVGKGRLAHWIAQLAVCESPTPAGPCDACRSCRMALALEHPDVHVYLPLERPKGVSGDRLGDALEDARIEALAELRAQPLRASHRDELRGLYLAQVQALRRRSYVQPTMAGAQVFVLLDAELLVPQEASPEAANALLKLLEEPAERTRLVLTSSEAGRLLPTILSRTVPVHLGPLPTPAVESFLRDVAGADARTAAWAAGLGQGSIGRALGFLPDGDEPGPLDGLRQQALGLLEASLAGGRSASHQAALGFPPAGARKLIELFGFVEEWLRDLAAVAAGAPERALNADRIQRLQKLVSEHRLDAADVAAAIGVVDQSRELARGNVNPQLIVSGLLRSVRAALRPARAVVAG